MLDKETLLATHAHRHVPLEGACNVRDMGGLPTTSERRTRRGVLYRSDTLAHLSPGDHDRLHALALRAIVDLRTENERARAPDRLPDSLPLALYNPGFIPRGNVEMFTAINAGQMSAEEAAQAMIGQYRNLTLDHFEEYRTFLAALLAPGQQPLLFHCASGKDRTGIAAAIVLLVLDVPREWVIQDYVISNYQRRPIDLFTHGAAGPAVEQVMAADPRYIEAALQSMVEAFGSIDAYLAEAGADREARRHLRDLLLD
jgi:protein-tyrosine phosphatase